MIKENFECKDLSGRLIEQAKKSRKSVEIDGNSKFCGHRFLLSQKLYGDKRCMYCGSWFHWCQDDAAKWIKAKNIDDTNVDKVLEPIHCGKSHCDDYHQRYLRHQVKLAIEQEAVQAQRMSELFNFGKSMGYIA